MNIIQILKHDEGLRLKPYRDSVGKLTIGIGRNIDDNGISEDEAIMMLDSDILSAITELQDNYPWYAKLDTVRADVITSMVFNMGMPTFNHFRRMIAAIEVGDYDTASHEMMDSRWARQVKGRADRLAYMMRTGEYHEGYGA